MMLSDTIAASTLLICIGVFAATNLHNILVAHRRRTAKNSYAEIERPSGVAVSVAAFATLVLFLETITFIFLVLGWSSHLSSIPLSFGFEQLPYTQSVGLALAIAGYSIFIWSVFARGTYATSWEMRSDHKLVTCGPCHYVRHPSYLSYFLMFISMPLIWINLLTFLPLVGIPGYYVIATREEKLLTQRFGNEYIEYQKRTGRFLPKIAHAR